MRTVLKTKKAQTLNKQQAAPQRRNRTGSISPAGSRHYPLGLVFLTGALMYLIIVIPFLIYHGGIFFYYGDYNVQQVPFYVLAGRAVHEGYLFWNSRVDLGSSMGGSFAFYLWGSPFFWISTLFPEKVVPYILPFLMSLKYGTALTCAYVWARTQTRTERGAFLAALLYAFSGLQAVNIVFQHMHDATAFFPLYLLAFDRFVKTDINLAADKDGVGTTTAPAGSAGTGRVPSASFIHDRLPFVLMTALSAVVNYYFFYGQVIFLILYYFVRYVAGTGRRPAQVLREIGQLLLCGILGLLLDSFFLIQVFDILQGNSRLNDIIAGYDMVAYSEPTTPLAILKSMFFIPDNIGRGTLFTSEQIRNSSLSAYLPGFAMAGVIGYYHTQRKNRVAAEHASRILTSYSTGSDHAAAEHAERQEEIAIEGQAAPGFRKEQKTAAWLGRFGILFAVIAFIPVLNAIFSALNNEYYARWFYMPILFLALMTVRELEESDLEGLRLGLRVDWVAYIVCIVISFLPSRNDDGELVAFQLLQYPDLFTMQVVCTGVCLFLATLLIELPGGIRVSAASADTEDSFSDTGLSASPLRNKTSVEDASSQRSPVSAGADAAAEVSAVHVLLQLLPFTAKPFHPGKEGLITRKALCLVMVLCLLSTMGVMYNGTSIIARSGGVKWQQQLLDNVPVLPDAEDEDTPFFRVETDGTSTNYEMVWGYPTIHCFESTVTPSIVAFYKGIGITRTVDSKMNFSHIGARYILSQRYYLDNDIIHQDQDYEDKGGLPGFTAAGYSDGYNIYQNQHFIPMGFTFDSFMTEDDYAGVESDRQRDRLLVENLILDDETAARYGALLSQKGTEEASNEAFSDERLFRTADERAATACTSFSFSQTGFEAVTSDLPKENLVFFSVPYDKGFNAYIDGEKTEVIRADFGLMAVDVPAGTHQITFTYLPYGLKPAIAVSLAAAALILLLVFLDLRSRPAEHC